MTGRQPATPGDASTHRLSFLVMHTAILDAPETSRTTDRSPNSGSARR
jgi:hypothetical protein